MIYSSNIEEYAFNDYLSNDLWMLAGSDGDHDYSVEFRYSGVVGYGDI